MKTKMKTKSEAFRPGAGSSARGVRVADRGGCTHVAWAKKGTPQPWVAGFRMSLRSWLGLEADLGLEPGVIQVVVAGNRITLEQVRVAELEAQVL